MERIYARKLAKQGNESTFEEQHSLGSVSRRIANRETQSKTQAFIQPSFGGRQRSSSGFESQENHCEQVDAFTVDSP